MSTAKKKKNRTSTSKQSPYEWTVDEVSVWIESLDYPLESKKFKTAMIDGSKLFSLNRSTLQNDVKVFDVSARNSILNAITKLKKEIKETQKNRIEKFASTHKRKEKKTQKKTIITDNINNRKYMKINTKIKTKIKANITIEHILNDYEFEDTAHRDLIFENKTECVLQYHSHSYFMFIICNSSTSEYYYLFTKKSVNEWNIDDVFQWSKEISNHQFVLFADELKRKTINGKKLLKYTRTKLMTDFGNFFDSTLRKKLLDEIKLLKQYEHINDETKTKKEKNAKRYHPVHQRSKSEIERDRIKRQQMRKAGPRDIGKINYHGTKYDESKDRKFLEDSIHPLSKDDKFQKRKEEHPVDKKQTVKEIGKNTKYDGITYDDSKDAVFLADRLNPLSSDKKFQKRKELNPILKKATVSEIGKVKYDGMTYDDSNDGAFLEDRLHPLSRDERFQTRKELNPTVKKATVSEIGKVKYDGMKYDDSNDGAFLDDRLHPLSRDERFQTRKELNPVTKKATVSQIGVVSSEEYKSPNWKLEDVVDDDTFLSQNAYYRARTAFVTNPDGSVQQKQGPTDIGTVHGFIAPEWSDKVEKELASGGNEWMTEKIRKEDKDYEALAKNVHKQGAVEVGKIHGFDAIDYELTKDDLMGGFLKERSWYDSSQVDNHFNFVSGLLQSLPSNKINAMYNAPLPSGVNTKIVWLTKLRGIVEEECKKQNEKDSKLRQQQLDELDAVLDILQKKPKEN